MAEKRSNREDEGPSGSRKKRRKENNTVEDDSEPETDLSQAADFETTLPVIFIARLNYYHK